MKTLNINKNSFITIIMIYVIIIFLIYSTAIADITPIVTADSFNDSDINEVNIILEDLTPSFDLLFLGKIEGFDGSCSTSLNGFTFEFSALTNSDPKGFDGTWSVSISGNSVWELPLFYSVKGGNGDPSWALYGPYYYDAVAKVTQTYDWTVSALKNGGRKTPELSHISFWTSDNYPKEPENPSSTPEPSTFVLLGLGLIFCSNVGRKRIKK